ncbi:uroporphyrinogen III methyltransferase [Terrihabitans soli]|uniref:Uroporphyrinogen III methyltransferase n=1 Tax=Terrihabitans soli TaxID=708113 RepID=A0A6S6QH97_9HYPH|nr:uroporphyrinogen-III synthase [Terrihabitans soli]BCJ89514.1 uroporphyrinogen III methyltransferase [Terrihabitans soli]
MILLTRPQGAASGTKTRLEAQGRAVLLDPLLELSFFPPERLLGGAVPDALVVTSSNGARAIARHSELEKLAALPVWTVGSRTTAALRELGFSEPRGEAPDVGHLAALLAKEAPQSLLYLAAENRAAELSELLPMHKVRTEVVYRATPASALAPDTIAALRNGKITDVLHYSRRLAEYYVALADAAGLGSQSLTPRQLCLSEQVAAPLREAGAKSIRVAGTPKEDALIGLLD